MPEESCGDGISGGYRRYRRRSAVLNIVEKRLDDFRIGASVPAACRGIVIQTIRKIRLRNPRTAFRPHANPAVSGNSEILQTPFRADKSIVSRPVRREETLLIGSLHPVVKLHQEHVVVLDINFRGKLRHFQRRPAVVAP